MATVEAMSSAETIEMFKQYVVPNYRRYPVSLARGEGSYVWDSEGHRYLDLFVGCSRDQLANRLNNIR